jgi:hypothetical protein
MTSIQQACVLAAALTVAGCRPSVQSSADTTAASSTVPAVNAGPTDSVTGAAVTGNTASGAGSETTTGATVAKKKAGTSASRSTAAQDSGVLGRDSVIRFPRRGLPTVSSTPSRQ